MAVMDGPFLHMGDNTLSCATAQIPNVPGPPHDRVPGEDLRLIFEDINIQSLLGGLGSGRHYPLQNAGRIFKCRHCALCRILTEAFRDRQRDVSAADD